MKKTIFYSWQSDLPNNTNRGFILDCLERSVKKTSADDLAIEYDVDRDTLDETGTPDIVSTIFLKIQNANVFLADVSIVTGGSGRRLSPNPNVLVELGFAASELSWDNIICVFNQGFGKIEDLPFDLRSRRILTYQLDENPTDKSDVRKELVSKLSSAIKDIHNDLPRLTRRLSQLFTAINPIIIQAISEGHRKFSVNLNNRNEEAILDIVQNTRLKDFLIVSSNYSIMSNNTNSNGGINDLGVGQLAGYNITLSETIAAMIR